MSIKQTPEGWKVDFRVGGKTGKRYRKTCKTKSEAERYQKFVEAQFIAVGKPWNEKQNDTRLLSELAELWAEHFGRKLVNYKKRRQKIDRAIERLGDPIATQLTPIAFSSYISQRLAEGKKPATINEIIMFLNAIYNTLGKLGVIEYENPIKGVERIKYKQQERPYLTIEQIQRLIHTLESGKRPEVALITRICLTTGARWGEAEGITKSNLANGSITFVGTKNGKNRTLPLNESLYADLQRHADKIGSGRLFKASSVVFSKALATANIVLPHGQKTHVLRHSFASHFMINGGNILTLKKILDHSDISMTMVYAHLAPNHMQEAIQFAPIR